MLNLRLREQMREAVVSQAELQAGRLAGSQPITVGFVDIVGFTKLGEDVAPEDLGPVVRSFERAVADAADPPVRLVKTIGDAAMLVAPEPGTGRGHRRPAGGALKRGATAPARRRGLRRGAVASGRLVRAPSEPGVQAHGLRAARQRRDLQGGS